MCLLTTVPDYQQQVKKLVMEKFKEEEREGAGYILADRCKEVQALISSDRSLRKPEESVCHAICERLKFERKCQRSVLKALTIARYAFINDCFAYGSYKLPL